MEKQLVPENEALRLVCTRGFDAMRPLGERAVKNVDDLRRHLAETRSRGYATAVEEAEVGTAALAVPFFSDETDTAPAVGTLTPRCRFLSGQSAVTTYAAARSSPLNSSNRSGPIRTSGPAILIVPAAGAVSVSSLKNGTASAAVPTSASSTAVA